MRNTNRKEIWVNCRLFFRRLYLKEKNIFTSIKMFASFSFCPAKKSATFRRGGGTGILNWCRWVRDERRKIPWQLDPFQCYRYLDCWLVNRDKRQQVVSGRIETHWPLRRLFLWAKESVMHAYIRTYGLP